MIPFRALPPDECTKDEQYVDAADGYSCTKRCGPALGDTVGSTVQLEPELEPRLTACLLSDFQSLKPNI